MADPYMENTQVDLSVYKTPGIAPNESRGAMIYQSYEVVGKIRSEDM